MASTNITLWIQYCVLISTFIYWLDIGPAPAISRLGINPYQWGTECLSGDVGAGPATSFPQSIGMVKVDM